MLKIENDPTIAFFEIVEGMEPLPMTGWEDYPCRCTNAKCGCSGDCTCQGACTCSGCKS